jgi:hypothetical protein
MRLVAMLASIALQGLSAVAGEKSIIPDQHSGPSEKTVPDWSFDVNSNYVFGSHFAYHRDYGSQSALNSEIKVGRRFRLWDTWYARFGFDLERFEFFKAVDVFPESLNSIALVAALEYWHGEDVGFYLELSPGVYFSKKITATPLIFPSFLARDTRSRIISSLDSESQPVSCARIRYCRSGESSGMSLIN